jgi:hypothetical protein
MASIGVITVGVVVVEEEEEVCLLVAVVVIGNILGDGDAATSSRAQSRAVFLEVSG